MGTTAVTRLARTALEQGEGVLRLAPNWVPRSFLHPGRRLKLVEEDLYALGAQRGGIDERWLSSTIPADNPGAPPDEGLSYVVHEGRRFTLRDAIAAVGADIVGRDLWERYQRWPVFGKFFDNMGPIPHHLHQNDEQAALVGQQGKPEAYYFPPQMNHVENRFPYTFLGLEPGTTKADVRRCLERWDAGDNGILDLSKAYRLRPGTGWLVGPGILHAPGSLLTFEPQWASDVFAMFQSVVEDRPVPRELLTKDIPPDKHDDLDFIVDLIDWAANTDPEFRRHHVLEPIPVADSASEGYVDRWVVYGQINGRQLFTAKELTLDPGVSVTIRDGGAYGLIVTQGRGSIHGTTLECPTHIRYGQLTADEVFVTAARADAGVAFENTSKHEPLVVLRYFGPDANPAAPLLED
ncbi:MAG: hypothetical protein KKB50_21450 [Planctomycetes bacterium]|nr:hypothetical protein [Planctomycetota bacterium]